MGIFGGRLKANIYILFVLVVVEMIKWAFPVWWNDWIISNSTHSIEIIHALLFLLLLLLLLVYEETLCVHARTRLHCFKLKIQIKYNNNNHIHYAIDNWWAFIMLYMTWTIAVFNFQLDCTMHLETKFYVVNELEFVTFSWNKNISFREEHKTNG